MNSLFHLEFSIKSSTHSIPFLRGIVRGVKYFIRNCDFDHKAIISCELAIVEAVNNAIFHAHQKDPDKWIDIELKQAGTLLEIMVYDYGGGFDMPEDLELPVDEDHGRGLFLIKSMMKNVEYIKDRPNMFKMQYQLKE